MLVLGWHGSLKSTEIGDGARFDGHDAAAVLIKDGRVVAAIEEERLNRLKHSNAFPSHAIRYCLSEVGAQISDVDAIITDHARETVSDSVKREFFYNPSQRKVTAEQWVARLFENEFKVDVSSKIRFCPHHQAHLYAAWYTSGYRDALGMCLDGGGDDMSGLIARCSSDEIEILRQIPQSNSLGIFYIAAISYLGYHLFDEYKVMGLAPYGDPTKYRALFDKMYNLNSDGHVEIMPFYELYNVYEEAGLAENSRKKGDEFTQDHKDYAAALQTTLERMCWHMIDHFANVTGSRNLCMTGGVAQNCTMNGKILKSGRFENVHVQPAAHDAGNALGAALFYLHDNGRKISPDVLPNLYVGRQIGTSGLVERRLGDWHGFVTARKSDNVHMDAAKAIADREVIAWVQGRSEFGPRALGNRSILADPRPNENKARINAMIKKREGYRPFAPSVLEENLHDYFDLPQSVVRTPFMVVTVPVRSPYRELLGAVTHVDGSARVQSVSHNDNPDFHNLISQFSRLTGLPIVLNTSFNNNFEPIVDSVDDAITCFLTTELDKLFISDWVIEKVAHLPLLELSARLSPGWKLSCAMSMANEKSFSIEPTASVLSGSHAMTVSSALFRILEDDDDGPNIGSRCATFGIDDPLQLARITAEVSDLWHRRMIVLSPTA